MYFEALVGAIYMDMGLLHAKEFILRIYNNPIYVNLQSIMIDDNFKDHLMRYCQSNSLDLPVYSIISHENGTFCMTVYVGGVCLGTGYAKNKNKQSNTLRGRFFIHLHKKLQQNLT